MDRKQPIYVLAESHRHFEYFLKEHDLDLFRDQFEYLYDGKQLWGRRNIHVIRYGNYYLKYNYDKLEEQIRICGEIKK
jgi:hypothetical protein